MRISFKAWQPSRRLGMCMTNFDQAHKPLTHVQKSAERCMFLLLTIYARLLGHGHVW